MDSAASRCDRRVGSRLLIRFGLLILIPGAVLAGPVLETSATQVPAGTETVSAPDVAEPPPDAAPDASPTGPTPPYEQIEALPPGYVGPPVLVLPEEPVKQEDSAAATRRHRKPEKVVELPDDEMGPPLALANDPCEQFDADYDSWIDSSQVALYKTVCGATAWFDGFFGDRRYDQATGNTFGRISLGTFWDQREGFDPRFRFRARFALPAMRRRGSLIIARGDEDEVIDERTTSGGDPNPAPPSANQQDSTFVGFGFSRLRSITRGLDFSVGVRLRTPIEPIVKIKYLRAWQVSERDLVRFRPIVYWRSQEGIGTTVSLDYDHALSQALLFRWGNFANASQDEEIEGLDWGSTLFLFQGLSKKSGVTYSMFVRGETGAEVPFKDAGLEIRFRQRFLRDWLFLEYNAGVDWPRFSAIEERRSNYSAGIRLEAYFGPAPDEWMR